MYNKNSKKLFSVVVPCHNEELNLELLAKMVFRQFEADTFELILVDDGSSDNTWEVITNLGAKYRQVRGLRLSRNFGHQHALYAGMCHAKGDAVITMDGDFQHPPEIIPDLIAAWRNGAQVVNTIRKDSGAETAFKRWTSAAYYRVFSFLCGVKLQAGMADFRLLDRKVVDALKEFEEESLFLRGLVQWVGYRSESIEFVCQNRYAGESSYNLKRMLKFAWDGITSFSIVPLRVSILLGLMTSGLAFSYLAYAVVMKLTMGTVVSGWASAVSIMSLLFGVLFILLGVLGEYIGRILVEVRGRPRFLIADEVGDNGFSVFKSKILGTAKHQITEIHR